jgi:hypothetical protein
MSNTVPLPIFWLVVAVAFSPYTGNVWLASNECDAVCDPMLTFTKPRVAGGRVVCAFASGAAAAISATSSRVFTVFVM